MSTQRNHHSHRSLRASARTALLALLTTGATACIFIDEIDVNIDEPTLPPADSDPTLPPADSDPTCAPHEPPPDLPEDPCVTTEHGHEDPADTTGEPGEGSGGEEPTPTSGDEPVDLCGDGVVDPGEVCDDGVNDGAYGGCMGDCAALAPFCGDGERNDALETCDDGNTVDDDTCSNQCQRPRCGDGVVQGNEQCEGGVELAATCESLGFDGGELGCVATRCRFATELCFACGDGQIGGDEACDGAELGGATCEALGFAGGQLGCGADCSALDVGGCLDALPVEGCCVSGDLGSCQLAGVESCVCAQAPECCESAWTEQCVTIAVSACFAQCA